MCGARRPDSAGDSRSARTRRRRIHQRAGAALRDQAARRDEASRRACGCRPHHPVESRTHRDDTAPAPAHEGSHGLAAPLRTLLVERPRSARGLCRKQGSRSEEEQTMTSLTLVRRIKARPSIVFDALTTAEGIASWWGPDGGPVLVAETDAATESLFAKIIN